MHFQKGPGIMEPDIDAILGKCGFSYIVLYHAWKRHRQVRDLRGAGYVGGFAKHDKVYPVVTICIYFGKEPYDGAKELFHMMDYETLPGRLRGILNNYKIQVLELRSFEDIDCFRTGLREVFGFIKHSNDKNREWEFAFQNEETFQCLDEDAFDVIVSVTGSAELEQIKDMYCEEGGKINMCEAIRGMIEDGRIEGVKQGLGALVEVCRELGLSKEDVVSRAMGKFSLPVDETEDLIDRYWKD